MNITFKNEIANATEGDRKDIIQLLQAEKLPTDDLQTSLEHFFIAKDNDKIIGVVGLEKYNDYGLLRSMVVDKEHRNKNTASELVKQLEMYAKTIGINCIYLLTETASGYFERKGFQKIARDQVPEQIKASSEFSHVCPVSAIVMKKPII